MLRVEKTAKTVDEAIKLALEELGMERHQVDVLVMEEGSKGIFGLLSQDARVWVTPKTGDSAAVKEDKKEEKADKKSDKKAEKAEKKAEKEEKKAGKKESDSVPVNVDAGEKASVFLKNMFGAMEMNVAVDTEMCENNILKVNLSGDNMGAIIGKRGDTLDAVQYLTSLVVNKRVEGHTKVVVDTENYRERRSETLIKLAKRLEDRVIKTRRSMSLEPMSPSERRIIHEALQDSQYVTTYSTGEEPRRKVVITLKK